MSGNLCYSCYDDATFRMHGYVPGDFRREIKRYVEAVYEGLTVDCEICGRKVVFNRDLETGKWRENEVSG